MITIHPLVSELHEMYERDQKARFEIINSGDLTNNIEERFEKIRKIDEAALPRLREIIDQYGWPGISLLGEEGSERIWLLIQHCDLDVPFQRKCLDLMKVAVERGEAKKDRLAYLTDRVLLNEERPQVYGTQCQVVGNEMTLRPTIELEKLDERRESVGLSPIATYLDELRKSHHLDK